MVIPHFHSVCLFFFLYDEYNKRYWGGIFLMRKKKTYDFFICQAFVRYKNGIRRRTLNDNWIKYCLWFSYVNTCTALENHLVPLVRLFLFASWHIFCIQRHCFCFFAIQIAGMRPQHSNFPSHHLSGTRETTRTCSKNYDNNTAIRYFLLSRNQYLLWLCSQTVTLTACYVTLVDGNTAEQCIQESGIWEGTEVAPECWPTEVSWHPVLPRWQRPECEKKSWLCRHQTWTVWHICKKEVQNSKLLHYSVNLLSEVLNWRW